MIIREREQRRHSENSMESSPGHDGSMTSSGDSGAADIDAAKSVLHSKRFRDYCENIVNTDVDNAAKALIRQLGTFQDRAYAKDPNKVLTFLYLILNH